MFLARVIGSVVSTKKDEAMKGRKLVILRPLLVDYVMTVAVSVASGVDNIISAIPALNPFRVEIAVGFIILLAAVNLRPLSGTQPCSLRRAAICG